MIFAGILLKLLALECALTKGGARSPLLAIIRRAERRLVHDCGRSAPGEPHEFISAARPPLQRVLVLSRRQQV